jgi:hypothetical protein
VAASIWRGDSIRTVAHARVGVIIGGLLISYYWWEQRRK